MTWQLCACAEGLCLRMAEGAVGPPGEPPLEAGGAGGTQTELSSLELPPSTLLFCLLILNLSVYLSWVLHFVFPISCLPYIQKLLQKFIIFVIC